MSSNDIELTSTTSATTTRQSRLPSLAEIRLPMLSSLENYVPAVMRPNRSNTGRSLKSLHEEATESPLLRVEEEVQEVVYQNWIPWLRYTEWSSGINRQRVIKYAIILSIPIILYLIFSRVDVRDILEDLLRFAEENRLLGSIVFVLTYALLVVLLIPGTPFIIGAGVVFQPPLFATLLCVAGSAIGAVVSFTVARYLFRQDVVNWLGRREATEDDLSPSRFATIDRAIATSDGWTILLLLRLSPVIPFSLLNYILALTDVSFVAFISSSCLGIIPGTVMYTITGSLIGTIAGASKGLDQTLNPTVKYLILYFSTLMIILSTALITVAARRALRRALAAKDIEGQEEEDAPPNLPSWQQIRSSATPYKDFIIYVSNIVQSWLDGYTQGEKRFLWWIMWGTLASVAVGTPLIILQTS